MRRDRADAVIIDARSEGSKLGRRSSATMPGGGVVREDLDGGGPDGSRPVRRLDHAMAEGEMHADATTTEGRRWIKDHVRDGIGGSLAAPI
jgi:hypothetical protein